MFDFFNAIIKGAVVVITGGIIAVSGFFSHNTVQPAPIVKTVAQNPIDISSTIETVTTTEQIESSSKNEQVSSLGKEKLQELFSAIKSKTINSPKLNVNQNSAVTTASNTVEKVKEKIPSTPISLLQLLQKESLILRQSFRQS